MKVSSALLGVALIAVSGVALHFWRELEAGRQQIASLTSEVQDRQSPTEASPISAPAQISSVAGQQSQASKGSQLLESPDGSALVPKGLDTATLLKQLASPEGMAERRSRMRHMQESLYPDVDQALGLTTAETDRLLDLLAMQRLRGSEAGGIDTSNALEREAKLQKERVVEDAELQALLGTKYPKLQEYRETMSVWQQRRDLRSVLDAAGFPLTQTQDRALINALSAEQRSINQTQTSAQDNSSGSTARYTPVSRQRLLDAAAPYLSPQQLDGYQGLLERRAAQEQAALGRLRR